MLKESEKESAGQRLLKQLRDEYQKAASRIARQPHQNIPPARISGLHSKSLLPKSKHR